MLRESSNGELDMAKLFGVIRETVIGRIKTSYVPKGPDIGNTANNYHITGQDLCTIPKTGEIISSL
jgi:hypothetical protein